MPILAPYPVLDSLQQVNLFAGFEESRSFAFRSLTGEEILPFTGNEFIARWGIQNLDVPARQVVEGVIPGQDGTEILDIKIGSRSYVIPIFVGSNSGHLSYLRDRARMRAFFNHRNLDYKKAGGSFDLVAYSAATGERTLRSLYVDGMNGQWDQETAGSYWETFGLSALAVNPYWDGGRWSSESFRMPAADAWFGFFPPRLAPKSLLNSASPFTVEGDAQSFPELRATGPCSSLTVTCDDLLIDIPEGLANGETLLVNTDPRTKTVLFDGLVDWSRLSPLSILAPVQPGEREVIIDMEDPTTTSEAQLSGVKWFETPW